MPRVAWPASSRPWAGLGRAGALRQLAQAGCPGDQAGSGPSCLRQTFVVSSLRWGSAESDP